MTGPSHRRSMLTRLRSSYDIGRIPETAKPSGVRLIALPWGCAREHAVQRGDAFALRAGGHGERAVLAALDAPGGPTAAVVLDLDERLQFSTDGLVIFEGEAQAVRRFVAGDP